MDNYSILLLIFGVIFAGDIFILILLSQIKDMLNKEKEHQKILNGLFAQNIIHIDKRLKNYDR